MIAEALQRLLDASRFEHIDADAVNHRPAIIRETPRTRGRPRAIALGEVPRASLNASPRA
jgi:hypothetical protein